MKVVIAVNKKDIAQAERLSELFLHQGGLKGHSCVLIPAPSVAAISNHLYENLTKAFGACARHVPASISEHQGATLAANQMWQAAVRYMRDTQNVEEWYWFEPDCVPLNERWADEIARDYLHAQAQRKFFLGKLVQLATPQSDGTMDIDGSPNGTYMVGTGVYPARLDAFRPQRSLPPSPLWSLAKQTPWDVLTRLEVVPNAAPTEKIFHNWGTKNYKYHGDGKFTCDLAVTPTRSTSEFTIPPTTLVIHGCKDTSLIDILMEDIYPNGNSEDKFKTPKVIAEETVADPEKVADISSIRKSKRK